MVYHKHDQLFAVGTLCLGLYLAVQSFGYPAESALFPRGLSILLLAMSLILLFKTKSQLKRVSAAEDEGDRKDGRPSFALADIFVAPAVKVFGAALGYVLLIRVGGYVVATVIFMAAFMWLLGYRRPVGIVIWAGLFSALLYGLFFVVLGIPAPESLFAF